jgi:hypothetical protein
MTLMEMVRFWANPLSLLADSRFWPYIQRDMLPNSGFQATRRETARA